MKDIPLLIVSILLFIQTMITIACMNNNSNKWNSCIAGDMVEVNKLKINCSISK